MNKAYLALGSNINPDKNIPLAIRSLANHPDLELVTVSSTWQTISIGLRAPDFHNAAALVSCTLDAFSLKENVLCEIEHAMGRVRLKNKNAPRTIDIDIVVFNDEVLDQQIFFLDHLLLPLAEILPDLYSSELKKTLNQRAGEALLRTKAKKLIP